MRTYRLWEVVFYCPHGRVSLITLASANCGSWCIFPKGLAFLLNPVGASTLQRTPMAGIPWPVNIYYQPLK